MSSVERKQNEGVGAQAHVEPEESTVAGVAKPADQDVGDVPDPDEDDLDDLDGNYIVWSLRSLTKRSSRYAR
jgi:hypothetical protein